MYGKNPNHANKFRRFFNKKYSPGNRCVVYSAISAGCIGHPAGSSCPCRGAGRKNGPEILRSGPESSVKAVRGTPGDRTGALRNIRDPLRAGAFGTFGERAFGMFGGFLGGVVRGGADCSFGSFADGPDADRAASGCGYLISRSGCSRRKCSQLCDPLREAAFLPPPSPLTRSGPRTAWSGLEVV